MEATYNIDKFRKLGLDEELLNVIKELGFEEPSDIQREAIPYVLEERDVIGKAATGSGKTLVFGAGIIKKVVRGKGIQALVLTPTRELAEQVSKALKLFSKNHNIKTTEVYGGVSMSPQVNALRYSEVVVGTPGRILDHLQRGTLNLKNINILVLDEADRMLDMGFIDDVQKIMNSCPRERQTLLFSATVSIDIEHIAKRYMKNPEYIEVESYVDPSKLSQIFYEVPNYLKFSLLVHLLKQEKSSLVMVFCNTRRNTDLVARNLKRYDLRALAIHGGLEQNKRTRIMENFHAGDVLILVCTDVAARGLDIKNVTHVYNYDSPKTSDEYIHRIGRTARAGEEGIAISLISEKDFPNFRRVCADHSLNIKSAELPDFEALQVKFESFSREGRFSNRGGGRGQGGGGRGYSRGGMQRRDDGRPRRFTERGPRRFSNEGRGGGREGRRDSGRGSNQRSNNQGNQRRFYSNRRQQRY